MAKYHTRTGAAVALCRLWDNNSTFMNVPALVNQNSLEKTHALLLSTKGLLWFTRQKLASSVGTSDPRTEHMIDYA